MPASTWATFVHSFLAHHQDQVGGIIHQILLESHHDSCSLFGLRATTTAQIDIWLGDVKLFKEGLAHLLVVMLTSMHETIANVFPFLFRLLDGMEQWRNLHEIGARASYESDVHFLFL